VVRYVFSFLKNKFLVFLQVINKNVLSVRETEEIKLGASTSITQEQPLLAFQGLFFHVFLSIKKQNKTLEVFDRREILQCPATTPQLLAHQPPLPHSLSSRSSFSWPPLTLSCHLLGCSLVVILQWQHASQLIPVVLPLGC
jgi:hypothetical protein